MGGPVLNDAEGWGGGVSEQAVGALGEDTFRGILPPGRPHSWSPWAERVPQWLSLCQEHLETGRQKGGAGGRRFGGGAAGGQ